VVSAFIVWEPDVALLPDQSPEAVQLLVLALLQLKVVEPFSATVVGLADRFTTGADGATTVTLAESLALPPGPLQVSVKLRFAVRALIVWEPDVALLPDQSPEAVQLLVLALLQLKVVEPFITTLFGLADRETVGATAAATAILTVSLTSPPGPVQVNTKVLSLVSELMDSVSTVFLLPDQSPEAAQLSTLLEDQFNTMLPLKLTLVKLLLRTTLGLLPLTRATKSPESDSGAPHPLR